MFKPTNSINSTRNFTRRSALGLLLPAGAALLITGALSGCTTAPEDPYHMNGDVPPDPRKLNAAAWLGASLVKNGKALTRAEVRMASVRDTAHALGQQVVNDYMRQHSDNPDDKRRVTTTTTRRTGGQPLHSVLEVTSEQKGSGWLATAVFALTDKGFADLRNLESVRVYHPETASTLEANTTHHEGERAETTSRSWNITSRPGKMSPEEWYPQPHIPANTMNELTALELQVTAALDGLTRDKPY